MAKKVIVAYIPAIHQGYRRLFEQHPTYRTLYILGKDITNKSRALQKEIRALDPQLARQSLEAWGLFDEISVIDEAGLRGLGSEEVDVLLPDDAISRDVIQPQYLEGKKVSFSPIFLRWDRRNSEVKSDVAPDAIISSDELAQKMLGRAAQEGLKSSNIWRRVGAVLAQDGEVIAYSSNQHRPSEHSPWIDGDVRAHFSKGVGIDMSTDQHAESCVIAEAARTGTRLEGADLYVDTFPCPPCAMLIAYSGIRRVFYASGYAVLDGERVLKAQDVEIYHVRVPDTQDDESTYVVYPSAE
jgi:dCMP deaminase